MKTNLPLFIGLRYTRGKHRNGFLSFVSLLSFIAMTLGVMALIIVLSVMNGFDREIKTRVLNIIPHATVSVPGGIKDWFLFGQDISEQDNVDAFSPYVEGYGMLSSNGRNQGVLIQGIDPQAEQQVTDVNQFMQTGDLNALEPGKFEVVIGMLMARTLGVGVGDTVVLSLPELSVTPVGVFPRYKRFKVAGIFQVGAQVDNGLMLIHFQDAQKLFRLSDRVSGVRLKMQNPFSINDDFLLSEKMPEGTSMTTWGETMASLFQAIKMEKTVVGTLLAAIIAVAAFNIIASLVLMVGEKRADIAVLRTLGAEASSISWIFIVQGSAVGIGGVILGLLLGCPLAFFIGDILHWFEQIMGFYLFNPDVFFISQLPSLLLWQDILMVSTLGILLSILATLYPAYRASKVLPAEALRYDH